MLKHVIPFLGLLIISIMQRIFVFLAHGNQPGTPLQMLWIWVVFVSTIELTLLFGLSINIMALSLLIWYMNPLFFHRTLRWVADCLNFSGMAQCPGIFVVLYG